MISPFPLTDYLHAYSLISKEHSFNLENITSLFIIIIITSPSAKKMPKQNDSGNDTVWGLHVQMRSVWRYFPQPHLKFAYMFVHSHMWKNIRKAASFI